MFEPLAIPGLMLFKPQRHSDARGAFVETWSERLFKAAGLPLFVQDNEALSHSSGTVRGLHFQTEPFSQAKLIRCVSGAVCDVVVDIRAGSPLFGRCAAVELTPASGALFVPTGCAHGYCTLAPETRIFYKVSAPYSPEHEAGIAWDDPDLAIDWRVPPKSAIVSDRDRRLPRLSMIQSPFVFER